MAAIWCSVGSVGTSNAADLSKLVFIDSIVQLGPAAPVGGGAHAKPAIRPVGSQVTAVVRYGVDAPDSLIFGVAGLKLRFCDGIGFVTARFIATDTDTGTETVLLDFDSRHFGTPSGSFRVKKAITPGGGAVTITGVDNAYYIELTLSAFETAVVPEFPPAVSNIELVGVGSITS